MTTWHYNVDGAEYPPRHILVIGDDGLYAYTRRDDEDIPPGDQYRHHWQPTVMNEPMESWLANHHWVLQDPYLRLTEGL